MSNSDQTELAKLIDRLEDIDPYDNPGFARTAMQEAAEELRRIQRESQDNQGAKQP